MRTGSRIRMPLILAVLIITILVKGQASAKESIDSEGNIVMDNGDMALYASDFAYLEAEKNELLSELPVWPDADNLDGIRRGNIKSRGIIDYAGGQVIIDASDLTYLADEIDALEAAYKLNTVAALNRMGTYYMQDGSITHDESAETLPLESAVNLSFDEIYEGVLQSQSVENLATTEILTGASADNLTAGTASWVDGTLVIGNGADNDSSYQKGYDEGYQKGYNAGRTQGQKDVISNPGAYGVSVMPKKFAFLGNNNVEALTDSYTCPAAGTYNIQVSFSYYNDQGHNSCHNLIRLNINGSIYTFLNYHFEDISFIHEGENAANGQVISVNLPAGAVISIESNTGDSTFSHARQHVAWVIY